MPSVSAAANWSGSNTADIVSKSKPICVCNVPPTATAIEPVLEMSSTESPPRLRPLRSTVRLKVAGSRVKARSKTMRGASAPKPIVGRSTSSVRPGIRGVVPSDSNIRPSSSQDRPFRPMGRSKTQSDRSPSVRFSVPRLPG